MRLQDIIITSLPTGPAVMDVFTDPTTGILAATTTTTKPDDRRILFLDTSTIEVSTSRAVLEKVEASGLGEYIDAPVSGGIPAAEQGTLTFMVGGSKATFARARPVMELMGTQFFHCGKPGAGLATKQINNYIAYCSYIALCEGMHTGVQYGLDPKTLSGMCFVLFCFFGPCHVYVSRFRGLLMVCVCVCVEMSSTRAVGAVGTRST
jgi:3-hydroxyisobutyrate dehydrogenase